MIIILIVSPSLSSSFQGLIRFVQGFDGGNVGVRNANPAAGARRARVLPFPSGPGRSWHHCPQCPPPSPSSSALSSSHSPSPKSASAAAAAATESVGWQSSRLGRQRNRAARRVSTCLFAMNAILTAGLPVFWGLNHIERFFNLNRKTSIFHTWFLTWCFWKLFLQPCRIFSRLPPLLWRSGKERLLRLDSRENSIQQLTLF